MGCGSLMQDGHYSESCNAWISSCFYQSDTKRLWSPRRSLVKFCKINSMSIPDTDMLEWDLQWASILIFLSNNFHFTVTFAFHYNFEFIIDICAKYTNWTHLFLCLLVYGQAELVSYFHCFSLIGILIYRYILQKKNII